MSELTDLRKAKDDFFRTDPQSPLNLNQRKTFSGLNYYQENPDLRFDLLIDKEEKPENAVLKTNTGDEQKYIRIGQIRFNVQGQDALLQVYVSETGGEYFIPFVDKTAPTETFGAGRYLEPEDLGGGLLRVDFNKAYNPYCAYNNAWSCPIPPRVNQIAVRIEAGEKKFHA